MAALLFDDITEGLQQVNCPFQPPDSGALKGMLGGKACSNMYSKIVVWLCDQMKGHVEPVSIPQSPDEEPLFRVELSTVVMELGCPVPGIGGADSLTDPNNRTAVLHYLVHELMSVRLAAVSHTKTKQINTDKGCFSGHPALQDLATIYSTLGLRSPGAEDEIPDIFETIIHKINEIANRNGETLNGLLSDPILKLSLKPEEWKKFEEVSHVLNEEYTIRFKTLLKRLDLTLSSFKWGKNKDKAETLDKVYNLQRRIMKDSANLGVADVLAARVDLACIPKTSSGSVRDNTKTKLNKMVIVGQVPDRGGRPLEQRPEPEIPSWQKDKNKRGRGGYHYQQTRGGQSQASRGNQYQQQTNQNRQQGYHQNRGYHDRMNNPGQPQNDQATPGQQPNQGGNRRGGFQNNRANRGGSWGGYSRGGGGNQGGVY